LSSDELKSGSHEENASKGQSFGSGLIGAGATSGQRHELCTPKGETPMLPMDYDQKKDNGKGL
jgi:hypothetical protein